MTADLDLIAEALTTHWTQEKQDQALSALAPLLQGADQ